MKHAPELESSSDLQTTNEQPMNTTNEQRGPFDWHEFPEGRARFIGGIRGVDELGHEGFVVEADGFPAMYGEIKRKFTENRNDYNLEIVSCGWPGKEWLGMPRPGLSYRFSEEEWAVIKSIVVRLVNAVKNYEDRPSFLTEYPTANFLENVFFVDGWAILDDEDADHAWPFFVNRADQKCSIA